MRFNTGIESCAPGMLFFKKDRVRRYKFAIKLLNLLSRMSKPGGYPRSVNIDWASIHRIGVFCQWGIGDAILMIPLLRTLRKVSNANIELLGKPFLRKLFESSGTCDHVHICVPPWTKFKDKYLFWQSDWYKYLKQFRELRKVNFDLLISTRYDPRETLQLRLLNSRIRAAYSACGGQQWLDVDFDINPSMAKMKHVVYDSKIAAEILTGQNTDPLPLLDVDSHSSRNASKWLFKNGYRGGTILSVFPGNKNSVRCWSDDSYNEVLKELPVSVGFIVIIVPPEENSLINIRWPLSIPGAFWKGSLPELQGILSVTDILLTVDSGVMHVGAACGCQIVAIFGPQLKQWFGPYTSASETIMVEPMPCRPCFDKCIYDVPICMKYIRDHDVTKAVQKAVTQIDIPRIKSFL